MQIVTDTELDKYGRYTEEIKKTENASKTATSYIARDILIVELKSNKNMRSLKIKIVYDYFGVSLKDLKQAFKYVAKKEIPDAIRGYFEYRFWVDDETHIQAQYIGRPFIVARTDFDEANKVVNRFLRATGKIRHEIIADSTNNFD